MMQHSRISRNQVGKSAKCIALLNECANICHVLSPKHRITKEVAHRAYERIVIDPCGAKRKKIDISSEAENIPEFFKKAIKRFGYIDEWSTQCAFNPLACLDECLEDDDNDIPQQQVKKKKSDSLVENHQFQHKPKKIKFWFITIKKLLYRLILGHTHFCSR
jgi:hypothetical protein